MLRLAGWPLEKVRSGDEVPAPRGLCLIFGRSLARAREIVGKFPRDTAFTVTPRWDLPRHDRHHPRGLSPAGLSSHGSDTREEVVLATPKRGIAATPLRHFDPPRLLGFRGFPEFDRGDHPGVSKPSASRGRRNAGAKNSCRFSLVISARCLTFAISSGASARYNSCKYGFISRCSAAETASSIA